MDRPRIVERYWETGGIGGPAGTTAAAGGGAAATAGGADPAADWVVEAGSPPDAAAGAADWGLGDGAGAEMAGEA